MQSIKTRLALEASGEYLKWAELTNAPLVISQTIQHVVFTATTIKMQEHKYE